MSYEQDQKMYNEQSEDTRECEAMRKMFVGGLARSTAENVFFSYFEEFGEMVDKVIITDQQTKESRGFGFITYSKSDSVEKVFSSRPHVIDNKTLDVKRAMPREFNTAGAHSKTKKLFIGGFKGTDLTPAELQEYIESRHPTSFGVIESIDFLKERDSSENKGFGFLMCSSNDFADRLAISESSFMLKGRNMAIKKAEPKEGGGMGGGGPRGGRAPGRGRGGPRGGGFGGSGFGGGGFGGSPRGGSRGGGGMRGGRGGSRGGRGGYNNENNYGSGNYSGGGNDYNTSYSSFDNNAGGGGGGGYNQGNQGSYGGGGYGQNQNSYATQSQPMGGYGNATGNSGSSGYGQQANYQAAGGYGDQSGYNQSGGYGTQQTNYNGGGRGGAARGGNNQRYTPY